MRRIPTVFLLASLGLAILVSPVTAQVEGAGEKAAEGAEAPPATPMEKIEALASETDERGAGERFRAFVDLSYRYLVEESPWFAATVGEDVGQDRWEDSSIAAIQRRKREAARMLEVLETIDRQGLDSGVRLDYDLLHRRFEDNVEGAAFPAELMPITQMDGIQQWVPTTLEEMPRRTVKDLENVIARLDAVPALVEDQLVLLRRGLAQGVTPPRVTLRDVPQQFLNLLTDDPFASPLLEAFGDLPDHLPPAERERLRQAAKTAYVERAKPAFEKLVRYLTLTYLPGARTSTAMKDLPGGEAWYAYLVRLATTTERTPQEIHELGLAEVERIRAEMEKVIAEIGFTGDLESFNEFLRTHSGFYYDDPEEMLRDYRDIAKRADAALPKLFARLPRLPYGVEPVPPRAAMSQTAAYYDSGSMERGRSATFYVNTYDLKSRPKWRMESLTLHEAVPGHHLQIALAQEREDLPWFRRYGSYGAFSEGWALYAESLGYEMGFYRDPYQKIGQLTSEMWRALRLVVDTGIHAFGWSRQQAIDYMYGLTGRTEHEIVVEVDRYIVWPAQALSYKVGELEIEKIRRRAEDELGERFDVRAFHDALLGEGALPLAVLEKKMDDWIAARKRAGDAVAR